MKIVLGEKNDKNLLFAEEIGGILASEICGIKHLKQLVDIYIPYNKILDNGFVENTNVYLEEVLLVMKINKIYYAGKLTNYITEIKKIYHVEIYTDLSV
ncbi:MAG: hypothetical protein IJX78_07180 [Bacilli bacterium]|nr:hypothetical protein [Bacilli bacterium]